MTTLTQGQIVTFLIKALPYPEHIVDIDLNKTSEVVFTWRGTRYRVDADLHVNEVGDGVLIGTDASLLVRKLLTMVHANYLKELAS